MRNATCVRTQTSKDPTRVAILFISYSMLKPNIASLGPGLVLGDISNRPELPELKFPSWVRMKPGVESFEILSFLPQSQK